MGKKTTTDSSTREMFRKDDALFDDSLQKELEEQKRQPVECLGMSFPNDEARREYFVERLREHLEDPEFRKIDGFPIGEEEDILALSDPPFYTACPNPFIVDFIRHNGKPYDPSLPYSREPFASDVSEGKNDPIYNAHSYHTKVPYKAIVRYILHYTEPGDIVFDGFCGTGMTGVAAQMCGDRATVEALGYKVLRDGTISHQEIDDSGKLAWRPFSKLGTRRAVLNDLSPAAAFIAHNYNAQINVDAFEREAKRILAEVETECGWLYDTLHTDGHTTGRINYTVWSDVFSCPECSGAVVFWEVAVNKATGKIRNEFVCTHCGALLTKRKLERTWITNHDQAINQTISQAKQVPVLINYTANGKRHEKTPDAADLELIQQVATTNIPYWFPSNELPDGFNTRQPKASHGVTHVHHFYSRRNLWTLAAAFDRARKLGDRRLMVWITASMIRTTRMYKYMPTLKNGKLVDRRTGTLSGTLYFPSMSDENSPLELLRSKIKSFSFTLCGGDVAVSTLSAESIAGLEEIDYIFVDPPFGANINYSELNILWESWLSVLTNNESEAIENAIQGKGPNEYRHMMTACFREAYRVLKPGRWMTVEFSNTKAAVWNSIQTALTEAGFIVANVSALDKQQGSFKAVTTPTAVKQDLVISAYKPNGGFESRFHKEAATEEGVWDFVRTHLGYLPVIKRGGKSAQIVTVAERDPRILYDRTISYYVRSGFAVPLNSGEFQQGLAERFLFRDGMCFLPEQAAEYDKRRALAEDVTDQVMFVTDESTAIQWLRQILKEKPQIFADINSKFMRQIAGWSKHEIPLDLRVLLEQNFIFYDGTEDVPSQIHAYLSSNFKDLRNRQKSDAELVRRAEHRWYVPDPKKSGDLEKIRERQLLKEYDEYRDSKTKRLKIFRTEAIRVGFKRAYDSKDYRTIIDVAEKLPDHVLQEDEKLLMYYDVALTRLGEDVDNADLF